MLTPQIENAINLIDAAFAYVPLGNGVSLGEADVIDDYGDDEQRAAAREHDELHDWQQIPDDDIENNSYALCFMDEEGLRFYLPAYMRFTLRRYLESESTSIDSCSQASSSAIHSLCRPDQVKSLRVFLTKPQIDAIQSFLTVCLEIDDDCHNVSDVALALRLWKGDEAAAEELKASQDASFAATREMTSRLSSLYRSNPEVFEKCETGDLTGQEQQLLIDGILGADAKCGYGGQQRNPSLWHSAFAMAVCVGVFVAMGLYMYFRLRQHGAWWLVGVGAILIAFVAFLLDLRRQNIGAR